MSYGSNTIFKLDVIYLQNNGEMLMLIAKRYNEERLR